MFYFLSKVLSFLLMPSGILLMLLVYAVYAKNRAKSKKIILLSIALFYIFTNPICVNELLLCWEYPAQDITKTPPCEVGIVLTGGIINDEKQPASNVFLGKSADRMAQALQLYQLKKIKKILISGGSNSILGTSVTQESDQMARFLLLSGVKSEDILLESNSRNTHENAINCSKILKKHFLNQKYILISSSTHLPRAIACFKKVGLDIYPVGSVYFSHQREFLPNYLFPHEEYLYYSQIVFHEIFGMITYKLLGYC